MTLKELGIRLFKHAMDSLSPLLCKCGHVAGRHHEQSCKGIVFTGGRWESCKCRSFDPVG